MASQNLNQEGYQRRLDFVHEILQNHGLEPTSIETLAYDVRCPFHFNNFLYKVDLAIPARPGSCALSGEQAATFPLPEGGASELVVRLSNPRAEGLNNANRVENEVAAQYLVRRSMQPQQKPLEQTTTRGPSALPLVPAVYAWAPCRFHVQPDETGFGWSILEFRRGSDLDGVFPTLLPDEKESVMRQIAEALALIQRVPLPENVIGFGALTIGKDGRIGTGQMPLLSGGPWDTYSGLWTAKLKAQLEDSDRSPLIRGWREDGTRERLEAFLSAGGVGQVLRGQHDNDKKVLIHGDLTMNNMLYDSTTNKLTTILDFDWAAVTHPCDEFLSGLWDLGGGIHEKNAGFQECVIIGDFSDDTRPVGLSADHAHRWELGKVWDAAAAAAGAIRPSTVGGATAAAVWKLSALEGMLCPFALSNEVMLRRVPAEVGRGQKAQKEAEILAWLADAGF